MVQLSATASRGCAEPSSTFNVDDGVDLNVAVNVKVGVKVEDNVNPGAPRKLEACCRRFEAIAPSSATQVTFARPRTRNWSTP
jgi:hypothetical protein